ncbi:hypothetical protein TL16_g00333 [Triparma laevis f. inornata]|uniref:Kinesin light chain n=1 Tax=Triparma laevis f. inornata TaxID=1714386 RepID=A0A9W6ZAG7_9STRA|nr:hypothetical protein TL16_g00333 [Triparma laevis f. inornata]
MDANINGKIEKLGDLLKRMERALGEENVVTFDMLNDFSCKLNENGEHEEAKEVWERLLAVRMKVLGEGHRKTLDTLNNVGRAYEDLGNYEKAMEYHERTLEGKEKALGKTHPSTLTTMVTIATTLTDIVVLEGTTCNTLGYLKRADELYRAALEGYEAQFGKDHESTKLCARNLQNCYENIKLVTG